MREIKFRLRVENKIVGYEKWHCGHRKSNDFEEAKPQWLYSKDGVRWRPDFIYHNKKDQYTGIEDKNESEVYDGDILCWEKYEGKEMQTRWVVKWVESKACYYDWTPRNGAMILGNIYENPELLEQKDKEGNSGK